MRVFITGATGFIGSHLARLLLQEGCEVFALLRPESDPWRIRDLLPDLHVVEGELDPSRYRFPIIPGHQVVGRIEQGEHAAAGLLRPRSGRARSFPGLAGARSVRQNPYAP